MRALLAKRQWQSCLAIFLFVRAASVWNRPFARFPDTIGYEKFDLLGRTDRFWPTTLVYWLVRNDTARVIVQVGIQLLAFAFLATVVVALCNRRIWSGVPVLVVASAPQITRFDLAILSESLGISFLVLAIGSVLLLLRRQSAGTASLAVVSIGLFAMTRPPQFLALIAASAIAVVIAVRTRTRLATVTAASFLVLSSWGAVQLHNNEPMSTLVFYAVLADHVVPSQSATDWFASNGMPATPVIRASHAYVYPRDLSPELVREVALPKGQMPPALMKAGGLELASWVKAHGWSTYARFVAEHPAETWRLIDKKWDEMLNPADSQLLPVSPRTVVPGFVFGNVLWWSIAAVLVAIVLAVVCGLTRPLISLGAMAAGSFLWFTAIVHTSGIEHGRHAITVAVAIRLLAVITIVYSLTNLKDQLTRNG